MLTVAATVPPASNLMWSQILDLIDHGAVQYHEDRKTLYPQPGYISHCRALMARYSRVPSHPDTVTYLAEAVGPKCVDVLVGNAWWSWLLRQSGVDVVAYDHLALIGSAWTWLPSDKASRVQKLDARCTRVSSMDDRALLLVAPRNLRQAAAALKAYNGPRCVYVGQYPPPPGQLADEFEIWTPVGRHRPVCWVQEPVEVVVLERRPMGRADKWPTMLVTEYSPLLGQDPPTSLSLSA